MPYPGHRPEHDMGSRLSVTVDRPCSTALTRRAVFMEATGLSTEESMSQKGNFRQGRLVTPSR